MNTPSPPDAAHVDVEQMELATHIPTVEIMEVLCNPPEHPVEPSIQLNVATFEEAIRACNNASLDSDNERSALLNMVLLSKTSEQAIETCQLTLPYSDERRFAIIKLANFFIKGPH